MLAVRGSNECAFRLTPLSVDAQDTVVGLCKPCQDDGPREIVEWRAFAERWVRTVRRDCLDHLLVLSRRHLELILGEYVEHYNRARPHRGLQLEQPVPRSTTTVGGKIVRRDILGGVIHEYELAA